MDPISDLRFEIHFGRAALVTPPYLVLHREEFAWPRVSPRAPVRSYIKPVRAAPFHPSPLKDLRSQISDPKKGWFVFCCTCRRPGPQSSDGLRIRSPRR